MTDHPDRSAIARPETDPTVPQHGNPLGTEGYYSGQDPGSFDNPTPGTVHAGAVVGGMPAARGPGGHAAANIPPEAGHRATIDPRTGEVHGSGAGAGGGVAGEDPDADTGGSNTGSRGANPAG